MKIDKKIKAAYEALPTPKAEDVLPAAAFGEEKRERSLLRPVIYAVATICLCAVIGVALMMNSPGNAPVIEGTGGDGENIDVTDTNATTGEREEVTTCEEFYAYLNIGVPHNEASLGSSNDTTDKDDPNETEKVLVKKSDGKELVFVIIEYCGREEIYSRYKEKYGEDYEMYEDKERRKNELVPKVLGREYQEGDLENKAVREALETARMNRLKLRSEIYEERMKKILEDFGYDLSDVAVAVGSCLNIYVYKEDLEKIKEHEYVSDAILWTEYVAKGGGGVPEPENGASISSKPVTGVTNIRSFPTDTSKLERYEYPGLYRGY